MTTIDASRRVRAALNDATRGLVDRDGLVQLIALAAVAREHLLVVGPPGTAKSDAVRRAAAALSGSYFEYLLGRFTEPSELFGPVDLARLRDGVVETRTEGMLPEAEVAFLDEVFLGSTAILNTLLGLLAERTFRRGHTTRRVPLRVCVGASNTLPDDPALAAFSDRFLLRAFVKPIPDPQLEDLLEAGWLEPSEHAVRASLEDVDCLADQARRIDPAPARRSLADAIRQLRAAGVTVSDRRAVKLQSLVTAAAALAGRDHVTTADLWPVIYAIPTESGQALAREALREVLTHSDNPTLPAAAEDASRGPRARASRLIAQADLLLSATERDARWRRRLEGVAREIDAGFTAESRPSDLESARTRVVAALTRD